MADTITLEELEKLWKWCGFKKHEFDTKGVVMHAIEWENTNGTMRNNLPAFTLDNLFKYAVPKLQYDRGYSITFLAFEHRGFRVKARE